MQVLYTQFECDTRHLGHLKKLYQTNTIMDHITTFERLEIHTEVLSNSFFKECFISGLKEVIRAHVMMQHPKTWLEDYDKAKDAGMLIIAQANRLLFITRPSPFL